MSRLWVPQDLQGKLKGWFDPETNITSTGGKLLTWQDRISGQLISHATAQISLSTYNGVQIVDGTGAGAGIIGTPNSVWGKDFNNLFEVYAFARRRGGGTDIVVSIANNFNQQYEIGFSGSTNSVYTTIGGNDSRSPNNSTPPNLDPRTIGLVSINGTTFAASLNGVLDTTPASLGTQTFNGGFALMQRSGAGSVFTGDLGDVFMLDPLTDDERYRLLAWMGHRWGHNLSLGLDNPYRLEPPTVEDDSLDSLGSYWKHKLTESE